MTDIECEGKVKQVFRLNIYEEINKEVSSESTISQLSSDVVAKYNDTLLVWHYKIMITGSEWPYKQGSWKLYIRGPVMMDLHFSYGPQI